MLRVNCLFLLLISSFFLLYPATNAAANQYPGVYTGENMLVFIQGGDAASGVSGVVVISYEYSMDWVITCSSSGSITPQGLRLASGHQYVYNADGTRRSESEFSSMILDIPLDTLEFSVLPSYGHFLAPLVRGGLAYAFVELKSGLPSQLALAREAYEDGRRVNLFEGFLYQFSEGELTAQIAFTEVAFGSEGLVRGNFPEDFPPPPENQPIPYPEYPSPSYPPPQTGSTSPANAQSVFDPTLPQGRELSPEETANRPFFTLEPSHNYDVPPIKRIGVVGTRSSAELEGYEAVCDEYFQEALREIEGMEVVYIPYDSATFGGAVMYDRAAWLCEKYGVDSLLLTELTKLEIPGLGSSSHLSRTARVLIKMKSKLIEGTGGSLWWEKEYEASEMHDFYQLEQNLRGTVTTDLRIAIDSLIADLTASGKLQGGHVD